MAIKASGYYKHFRMNTVVLLFALQIVALIFATFIAYFLWRSYPPSTAVIASLVVLGVIELLLAVLLVSIASGPLRILSQAIAHVSKDTLQTPPPTISNRQDKNGLKALVQTVYELATSAPTASTAQQVSSPIDSSILSNLPCGVIALNPKGQIIFSNHVAPVREDSSGQNQIELLFEQSNSLEAWLQDCQANKVHDVKIWHRVPDGPPDQENRRMFDVIGYYAKNGSAGVETILATVDRTAEYAPDDDNMNFIALAAHELRGPITVIRGYLDILDQELGATLQPNHQQIIDRLQVSAERLSGYVNNVLNVSRYDRNHLKLHLNEERLVDIIKNLIPDFALRAKTQNRRLTFYIPDNLPTIAADRSSLSEVITNLIDNAIKYSKDGGEVIISATVKENFVEITVQDFGIGMPESVVGNLFTKFYRSHRSRQQVSGTGLGLYICKAIAESHGGSIWVRSTESVGSTFGFTIPIYATVADKLAKSDNSNEQIIERSDGWIKNHAMYRR